MTRMSSGELSIEYDVRRKSMVAAYAMWFFIGYTGAHRFYLGRMLSAGIMLALWLFGLAAVVFAFVSLPPTTRGPEMEAAIVRVMIAMVPLVVAGLWHLLDVVLIPAMVQSANEELSHSLRYTPRSL